MKIRYPAAVLGCFMLVVMKPALATTIDYDVTHILGDTWEYRYTIANDSLGVDIEEFTVYFDFGLYANLNTVSTPATWDPVTVEPGNFAGNDGFYDALALATGIAPGTGLGVFSVRFDFLGAGTPGPQVYEIVEPGSFTVLDAGLTTSPVPLPAAAWLFACGLLGLAGMGARLPRPRCSRASDAGLVAG